MGSLLVRRMKTRFGDRAFSAAGPKSWNSLPAPLRAANSIDSFKTGLKTYLLSNAYRHIYSVTGQNGVGQNGMDKMVATFIDSNSTELNFYSVIIIIIIIIIITTICNWRRNTAMPLQGRLTVN